MRVTGALYLILLGLVVAAAGGVFTWLMWRSYERASGQRDWEAVPARILQSEVASRKIGENVPHEYSHGLLFGYEVNGERFTSERLTLRGALWSKDAGRVAELAKQYPVGSDQTAWVDPEDPAHAVLKLDSKAPGYSLWFPILILVGGLGVICGGVRNLLRARTG